MRRISHLTPQYPRDDYNNIYRTGSPYPDRQDRVRPAAGCWMMRGMTDEPSRVVRASRDIAAGAETIFELIADPARQPEWDGADNLASAESGQRVRAAGDVFTTVLTHTGAARTNHVTEFTEGRLIAWTPSEVGKRPPGHLWRWELEPVSDTVTRVTVTYDWTRLTDRNRLPRARWTTPDRLRASLDLLAALAESPALRRVFTPAFPVAGRSGGAGRWRRGSSPGTRIRAGGGGRSASRAPRRPRRGD